MVYGTYRQLRHNVWFGSFATGIVQRRIFDVQFRNDLHLFAAGFLRIHHWFDRELGNAIDLSSVHVRWRFYRLDSNLWRAWLMI